jgi:hypothetical protein
VHVLSVQSAGTRKFKAAELVCNVRMRLYVFPRDFLVFLVTHEMALDAQNVNRILTSSYQAIKLVRFALPVHNVTPPTSRAHRDSFDLAQVAVHVRRLRLRKHMPTMIDVVGVQLWRPRATLQPLNANPDIPEMTMIAFLA